MIGTVLAAICFCSAPANQEVKLQLMDGKLIQGELKGFENGRYRIQINGTIHEFAESLVVTVTLVDTAPPSEVIDVAGVIRLVKEGRDGAKAAEALVRVLSGTSADRHASILDQVASALSGRLGESFSREFAEALSRSGSLTAAERAAIAKVLETAGRAAEREKKPATAWTLYRAASNLDRSVAEAVRSGRIAQALAHATERLASNDGPGALQAIDDLLSIVPEHPDAKRLREEALYQKIQADLRTAARGQREELLREYLRVVTKTEYRRWAEEQMAQRPAIDRPTGRPDMSAELARWFPIEVGRYWKYRVGSGTELFQKVKVEAVRVEDTGVRVYFALENIYKNYTSTKSYQLLISGDAVAMSTGFDRESQPTFPLLRLPASEGESWEWQSGAQRFVRQITSSAKSVTTDAGVFENCLEITFTSTLVQEGKETRIVSRSLYAPGVGLVQLSFDQGDYQKHDLLLVEHGRD